MQGRSHMQRWNRLFSAKDRSEILLCVEMLLEAHSILIKNAGLDHTAVCSVFLAMGGCLHEIGDLKKARAANEEALRIFRIAVAYC